jgi:hypothetical protein
MLDAAQNAVIRLISAQAVARFARDAPFFVVRSVTVLLSRAGLGMRVAVGLCAWAWYDATWKRRSGVALLKQHIFPGVAMDSELRKRLDDFFDVGFGKTTGIDTALEITKIYAGSAAADPDKIPDLFVRLVQLFEPRLDVRD